MKSIKYLLICSLVTLLAVSCDKGLDPIEAVAPGPDELAPELQINYPVEGKPFVSPDEVATITFKFVAVDDIELKSIVMVLDGKEIDTMTSFKDYRRADVKYDYDNMTDGQHTFTVTVTDKTDKSVSESVNFSKVTAPVYTPLDGEVLYLPLDGFTLDLITGNEVTIVGTPGYAAGKVNDAYAGAADAYMTYPADIVTGSQEFSLSLWYKINAEPTRAGIFEISPESEDRTTGLRFFRENSGTNQNLGLNFGNGAEVWLNPFVTVPPDEDWMHIAIVISATHTAIYVNGEIVKEQDLDAPISWTGCTSISIASGEPNFVYWEHFSDLSLYDEIHLFKRALTAEEVQSFYIVKK